MAIGAIHDRVHAIDGKLEVRPTCFINMVVDHRFLDGGRSKILYNLVTNDHFFNILINLFFFSSKKDLRSQQFILSKVKIKINLVN